MVGIIRNEDLEELKERVRLEEVVSKYLTLQPAGIGSLKGLCPFHDEKTPSFTVRTQLNRWHCFGCGQGGDAISFVQQIESLSFVEAVEIIAKQFGLTLHYEEGKGTDSTKSSGMKQRLHDAHILAEDFYRSQLLGPEARIAREFLAKRGFDAECAAKFGLGYAPKNWDSITRVIREKGFTETEIAASGLTSNGNRGVYDRFRGRIMWPIRSIAGQVVGFGARILYEDDNGPKYINTPETLIYKKSQLLYGLDIARKAIATSKQIVVVEGYTDVMAAHLSGVNTAVATCGTAFGAEHIKIVRRILGDYSDPAKGILFATGKSFGGEVIFTFDGDSAGQKAAMRAFQEDMHFAAQTFIAEVPDNLDPCDYRLAKGEEALKRVIDSRRPLFEFAILNVLKNFDLHTNEGRVQGIRATAPIVSSIRDRALRSEYCRSIAGWVGMEVGAVNNAVGRAEQDTRRQIRDGNKFTGNRKNNSDRFFDNSNSAGDNAEISTTDRAENRHSLNLNKLDPMLRVEIQAMQVALQIPWVALQAGFDEISVETWSIPSLRTLAEGLRASGGVKRWHEIYADILSKESDELVATKKAHQLWINEITSQVLDPVHSLLSQLLVEQLPVVNSGKLEVFGIGVVNTMRSKTLLKQIGDLRSTLQRLAADSAEYQEVFSQILELEKARRTLTR